jgi:Fe-S cluster biosynthesis and repair protein YggX
MSRTVFCQLLKKQLPGLTEVPFPGPRGTAIFETYSAQAWSQWQSLQTMLINEKHLSMVDKNHRRYLGEQRDRYLSGQEIDQAEGYIEPD